MKFDLDQLMTAGTNGIMDTTHTKGMVLTFTKLDKSAITAPDYTTVSAYTVHDQHGRAAGHVARLRYIDQKAIEVHVRDVEGRGTVYRIETMDDAARIIGVLHMAHLCTSVSNDKVTLPATTRK